MGSSARRIDGLLTSARAIATRWRWPPDSSFGLCVHAVREAHRLERLLRRRAAARLAGMPA